MNVTEMRMLRLVSGILEDRISNDCKKLEVALLRIKWVKFDSEGSAHATMANKFTSSEKW